MLRHPKVWKRGLLTAGTLTIGVLVGTIMSAPLAGSTVPLSKTTVP